MKITPYLLAYSIKYLLKAILLTCRIQVNGIEKFNEAASKRKCILALWHNRLTLVAEIMTRYCPQFKYAAMVSNSKDAEALAIYAESFSVGRAIRVPHDARSESLMSMIRHLKYGKEVIVITPDGPRGPCYKVKPGIIYAAKETGANIIPMTWSANRCWTFNTWDKIMLPKPFSTITVTLGDSIQTDDPSTLETTLLSL